MKRDRPNGPPPWVKRLPYERRRIDRVRILIAVAGLWILVAVFAIAWAASR